MTLWLNDSFLIQQLRQGAIAVITDVPTDVVKGVGFGFDVVVIPVEGFLIDVPMKGAGVLGNGLIEKASFRQEGDSTSYSIFRRMMASPFRFLR